MGNRINWNKKGNIQDIALIIVSLFIFALVIFIAFGIFKDVENSGLTTSTAGNTTMAQGRGWLENLGSLFVWVAGLMAAGVVVLAFFLRDHPVYLFFGGILIFMFIVVVSTGLSDTFEDISQTAEMNNSYAQYGVINNVMTRLPLFALILGMLIIVALYATKRGDSGI